MIPKVIHYIWLGGNPLPKIAEKCMESWKKFCPDYEIKRWDESNLDLTKYQFVVDAIKAKKYAFASDVLRTEILYNHGGIYLDIDVELIKPIDEFLNCKCFGGFETSNLLNPGLIWGVESKNEDLHSILRTYETMKFDVDNLKNLTVCKVYTDHFKKQGLIEENSTQEINNSTFYSSEHFSPIDLTDGKLKKTKNTISIHHFAGSWVKKSTKIKTKFMQIIKRILGSKIVLKLKDKRNKKKNESSSPISK